MSAAMIFRETVRGYRRAFENANARAWWARAGAKLGLARALRFLLSDATWLAIVLADLEKFCRAGPADTTFVRDDAGGRESALMEGRRQVFMRLRGMIEMTPAEEAVYVNALLADEREDQRHAA